MEYKLSSEELSAHATDRYHTTRDWKSDAVYETGCALTKLFSWNVTNMAKVFGQDNPGEPEGGRFYKVFTKGWRILTFVVTIIPAVGIAAIGFPLRVLGKAFSNNMNLIKSDAEPKVFGSRLHLMTYNVGLVPRLFDALLDTSSSSERAKAIAQAISNMGDTQPDIICFQEVFDNESARNLFDGLKGSYHNILHSIVPSEFGVSSGAAIASKYPIKSAHFRRFPGLIGDDSLTKQGLLRVELDLGNGKTAIVYNTHLQSGETEKRIEERHKELVQIKT